MISNNIPSHQFFLSSFFFHSFRLLKSYPIVLLYVAKHNLISNRIEFLLKNQRGIRSLFYHTISDICKRFSNPAESNDRLSEQRSLLLSLGPQPTTTTHTGNKKNTGTMIATIRRPPAAPIREVSAIAVRRAIDYDDSDAAI